MRGPGQAEGYSAGGHHAGCRGGSGEHPDSRPRLFPGPDRLADIMVVLVLWVHSERGYGDKVKAS